MSTKATAARIYEYGEPDVFRFETMDVPDPVGHEVLVRNTVIGLNFVDIYYRRGTLPVPEFPAIIGDEASGVVDEAVGPNVTLVGACYVMFPESAGFTKTQRTSN